jgi:hypothetical protein
MNGRIIDAVGIGSLLLIYVATLLSVASAQSVVVEKPLGVLIYFRPDASEAGLRKIDYAGLTVTEATTDFAKCQAKASRVQFAEQLRHEPEIAAVFVDQPCKAFFVEWVRGREAAAIADLKYYGVKILHRGETLPFAVCEGPLTAKAEAGLRASRAIETVEPEALNTE